MDNNLYSIIPLNQLELWNMLYLNELDAVTLRISHAKMVKYRVQFEDSRDLNMPVCTAFFGRQYWQQKEGLDLVNTLPHVIGSMFDKLFGS